MVCCTSLLTHTVCSPALSSRRWVNSVGVRLDWTMHLFPPLGHLSKTTFPVVNFAEIDIDANGGSHRRAVEKSEHDSVQYSSSYGYFQPHPPPFPCPKGPRYATAPGLTPPLQLPNIYARLKLLHWYPLAHRTNRHQSVQILKGNIQRASPRLSVSTQQHPWTTPHSRNGYRWCTWTSTVTVSFELNGMGVVWTLRGN